MQTLQYVLAIFIQNKPVSHNTCISWTLQTLQWRHIEHDGISNHRRLDCFLNRLFRRRSKKTSQLRITGLCEGNPRDSPHKGPVTCKMFPFDDIIINISTCSSKKIRLTHCDRVTHICINKLTIIGSNNDLSPGRRQAIIRTNAGILLMGPKETNFSEILIEIYTFSFKKMHLKMSSGKWRPFCLSLNVSRLLYSCKFPNFIQACQSVFPASWIMLYSVTTGNLPHFPTAIMLRDFTLSMAFYQHGNCLFCSPFETQTKWLPFCKQQFQTHFSCGKIVF